MKSEDLAVRFQTRFRGEAEQMTEKPSTVSSLGLTIDNKENKIFLSNFLKNIFLPARWNECNLLVNFGVILTATYDAQKKESG